MTPFRLLHNIRPYVRPYRLVVVIALTLTLLGSLTAQVNAWVLRYTVDSISSLVDRHLGPAQGAGLLVTVSLILVVKEILSVLVNFGQRYHGEKLRIFISRDLSQRVIKRVLSYRMSFFTGSGNQPGLLQTRIDRGIESITRLVQIFFIEVLPLFANAAVALAVMFHANFYVGLVGFSTIPVYYHIARRQALRLAGSRRKIRSLRENKSQGILGILQSIPVIKSFLREDIEEDKQMGLQLALTGTQMAIRRTSFVFDGVKSLVEQYGVAAIIILTTFFVLKGEMTIGSIMFHILLYNNVSAPIRQLHVMYDQMNDALIYSEGFFDILHADGEVEPTGSASAPRARGEFVVKNVTFTYPGNSQATLHAVDMRISPGRTTALVGLSGAGKSTLINLLDKFYVPDSGEILLDDADLRDCDTDFVRANIGLVLQKNHIFGGTVAQNILYGNPSAGREAMEAAARQAYIHDAVMALPEGYETSALSLSGGQQQKLAIARLFLKNPPIIFLDEPTASLDAVATEQIKNSMDAIKRNRTVVIISHSISQIIDADMIYVMQDGRVAGSGRHEELYASAGAYRAIVDAMARSLNIEKIAKTVSAASN